MSKISLEKEKEIINLYVQTNLLQSEISRKTGVSTVTIGSVLKRNGIPKRKVKGMNFRKYNLNDHYFSSIDSHEKAYILGLMYADGYLVIEGHGTKRIGLDLIDKDILVEIAKSIDFQGEVVEITKKGGYESANSIYRLKMSSPEMYDDLLRQGMVKKNLLRFPDNNIIPDAFVNSFILGYIDGNGSIIANQRKPTHRVTFSIGIDGSEDIIKGILKRLDLPHLSLSKRKDTKNCSFSIRISGNNIVAEKLQWLYKDSNLFLKRKKEKFLQLQKQSVELCSNT